ncbi:MAG: L-2-amino-thiazoline-4-carboxylic acid hydrolase [Acidimicrobiia bacterium]
MPILFRFKVTRCHYIECYEGMELPPELVELLSCARDAPFARAYSPRLYFSRDQTLASGASFCDFCYSWRPTDE